MSVSSGEIYAHSGGGSNGVSPNSRKGMLSAIKFFSYVLNCLFILLLFVPIFSYTFYEPLPSGRGWMGNEYQLLLFGWELWGSYVNILLMLVFVSISRVQGNKNGLHYEIIRVVLALLVIVISWSPLFGILGMVFPLSTIPTVRDDEPQLSIFVPRYGGVLLVILCLLQLFYTLRNR